MFEKKRGKRFLASVMALVMLLSLAPVGALATETAETTNTFEARAYTQDLDSSSPNDKTQAYAMWKDAEDNYYLAIASVDGNNKVDEAFQSKFPNAQYIENDQGLTVKLDGEAQIDNLPPKQAADNGNGGPEGVWIILVMTPEEMKEKLHYNNSNGTFNLGIDAGRFNIGDITITDDAFKGTVDGDVNPQNTKTVIYNDNLPEHCAFVNGVEVPEQGSTAEDSITVAGLTGDVTENQVSGQNKTYTFQGWSENKNATEASYQVEDSLNLTKEVTTLYAIWKDTTESTPDSTPDSPRLVTAMFFINLGGKDASNREGIGEFTGPITIDDALNYTLFKEKKSTDMSSNKGYIFNENGVETPYPSLLNKEPTYEQINEKIPADKQGSMSVGDDTGREVVWYHVSHCGDGYHVDGYIKNVAITITYDPNGGSFEEEVSTVNGKHTEPGTTGTPHKIIKDVPQKAGYTFTGWKLKDKDSEAIYQFNGSITPTGDVTLVAQWEKDTTTPIDPENPTSEINAKYFVLTPSMTAPTDGSSRGVGNYFPNDRDCGGVEGKTASTGYPGKIKSTLLNKDSRVNTQAGYADTTNGIGADYLVLPADLGYFSTANYTEGVYTGYNSNKFPDVLKNLVGEGNQFNMNNYQIVWYVVKKESNGYHVDGYLKGVSIQLKYIDTFGGTTTEITSAAQSLKSGDKVTIKGQDIITATADRTGWTFEGWTTNADGTGKLYKAGDKETLITSTSLYAKWTTSYKVVTHFMDADGKETARRENSKLNGVHGTPLKDMVLSLDKVERNDISGNYVYVPSETSYFVGKVDKGKVGDATFTEANTVIHQYYYLDETGKIGKDEENKPTDKSDEIPDAWQHKVTFKVVNGSWDNKTNEAIVKYVTKKDAAGNNSATGTATLSDVPAVGNEPNSGYRASGSWDKSLSVGLEIKGDTEFTFTYSRRSSGGSSRPSTPPTVDIPDDVPTGLNGKDHYAYIIGYGNNDVRPQNNITRAEVATIFFRLLTDETRTANMTKSNSYNDVKDGDWFCCAVSTLSKMGIIKGYEDGSFKPNDPISRAEFAAIAARFDPDGDKTPASFSDVTSHWAKDEISIAANHGWIKGYEDGSFKPDQKITRAETMTLVNRVLNRLPEAKDDLHKDMKTWVDNMDETAWYYLAVQEATNSHYFKNKTSTKFEQWTDLRDTRDWSELEK